MKRLAAFGYGLVVVLIVTASGLAVVPSGGHDHADHAHDHLPDAARGVVFTGLSPASSGPCAGAFRVDLPGEVCTHGPDPAPPGIDVRVAPSTEALARAAAAETGSAAGVGTVPVIGDGVSGSRVVAIYAVAEDRPDRFGEIAPLIREWAGAMDDLVAQSASLTGGERHIRYLTDPTGDLVVERVVMPPSGDDTFGATISAVKAAGFDDPGRKYLIWTDATIYCGIANIYGDDRPGQDNANNGRYPQYGRVDSGCWSSSSSVGLHELFHNLGAVQQSAPNVTPGWHCTDEYDVMCYRDGSNVTLSYVCPSSQASLLDCGGDDYFHTSPANGTYLADHWNTADSSFLHVGPPDGAPPPDPTNVAPEVAIAPVEPVTLPDGALLDGQVGDDGLPGPTTVEWSLTSGPGTVIFASSNSEDTAVDFPGPGEYVLTLTATDGELTGSASVTVTVLDEAAPPPPPPGPVETSETFDSSLNKKWVERTFQVTVADGPLVGVLTADAGKGRDKTAPELTLTLVDGSGTALDSASGASVTLSVEVSAGTYTWEVSGATARFSLTVTYLTE
jgi:hypothetical protein